jgi:hypothetical protein
LQYPTGFACDVCDGIAVVEVNDGDHYLCAAHAIEPRLEIDLSGNEPIVAIEDAPTLTSNVIAMPAQTPAPTAVIADTDVQKLLTDVVSGLRAIRYRLESTPPIDNPNCWAQAPTDKPAVERTVTPTSGLQVHRGPAKRSTSR